MDSLVQVSGVCAWLCGWWQGGWGQGWEGSRVAEGGWMDVHGSGSVIHQGLEVVEVVEWVGGWVWEEYEGH